MPTKTKVKELMTTDVIAFKPDDKIRHITETLREKRISGAPVIDEGGKVIGVISESDIMNLTATIALPTLDPFNPIATFSFNRVFMSLPEEIDKQIEMLFEGSASDVMSKKPITVSPEDSISDVARIMHKNDFNRLPVVDDEGNLVGLIARGDIISVLVK
ncbi:MAG: CBS domain-containing protein [Halobacteriota archaeon]|nr:CBS domain-containing protein [Halobacteriota archaeon]